MTELDLILHNGRIYPRADPTSRVEALAINQGKVTGLGPTREIIALSSRSTEKLDLQGRTVLPGLSDSHIHILNYGMLLLDLDLTRTESIQEIRAAVSRSASSKSENEWILGRGWDDEKLRERRYLDKFDLDQAALNPVFLKRICGHVAIANSRALSIAGIAEGTADPEGGIVVRDSNGIPNGVLKERAIDLVESSIPKSKEETRKALVLASERLARIGLTSLHCIITDLQELEQLRALKLEGSIPQSIYALLPIKLLDRIPHKDANSIQAIDGFSIGGLKLYLDGSLGAHTAALKEPYNDDPTSSGMLTMSPEELRTVVSKASESDTQLCLHAIGDRAVELSLETIARTFELGGNRGARHRIEHASLVSRESIRKMSKLDVVASVQPRFIYSDSWARTRLGDSRLSQLYPFASMKRAGIRLAAGSDCPVEDPNPFEGIWSAVARPGLDTGEKLSVSEALAAYTEDASYASFTEETRGTLNIGKSADLIVVDRDPFESRPQQIRETKVLRTMIEGKFVS